MYKYSPQERIDVFWSKVDKSGGGNTCWIWQAHCNQDGYGLVMWENRKVMGTHQIAWILTYREIPVGLEILHTCDNPACVNPGHLLLGTQQENIADMNAKHRQAGAKGERNSHCKLTDDQIIEIRKRFAKGSISQKALGREYGVSGNHIGSIVKLQCRVPIIITDEIREG